MASIFLVLNAGSSSLKFKVFSLGAGAEPQATIKGMFEGLGGAARFRAFDTAGSVLDDLSWRSGKAVGHTEALMALVTWLKDHVRGHDLAAVGHRIVHGGDRFGDAVLIDEQVLGAVEALTPLAPLHQPHNLEPIRVLRRQMPKVPQIGCFDTAFHRTQQDIVRTYALPLSVRNKGVKRYGFHGLSYAYVSSVLGQYEPALARGRVIVAHLGNGASLCAIRDGASVATTMGFSALDGVPMGTRCGALDPAVVLYMIREMKLDAAGVERMLYTQSGLLGLSGLSGDMRTLRSAAFTHADARAAIDVFVYRIAREIGSLIAALDGLDALVFTGGIGENDMETRAEVLARLSFAGLSVDHAANIAGGPRISVSETPSAWVIPTNEELVIARQMQAVLAKSAEAVMP